MYARSREEEKKDEGIKKGRSVFANPAWLAGKEGGRPSEREGGKREEAAKSSRRE